MAASQFVIAGRVDCDQYARLESAADFFQSRLPSFRVHKEPHTALEWPCFLRRTCAAQGWLLPVDSGGPLVWRLLVQRGGRGLLVGGLSEFLQLAAVYYGLTPPELSPTAARLMAAQTAAQLEFERKQRRQERVALERRLTSVAVLGSPLSGAASHFLAALATGSVLGEAVPLRLQLLGDPSLPALAALRRELQDLVSPNLGQVALLPSVREAVRDASVIIVLDPIPNVLPPEPELTPPPTPPAEEPPPLPVVREPDPDETERDSDAEPATPAAPSARDPAGSGPAAPQPTSEDRLPGELSPSRAGAPGSARRSGDSRKLSIIVEDPDSEEKEEVVMEQLMASRRGSSRRSGPRSRTPAGGRPSTPTADLAAAAAAAAKGVPSALAESGSSNGGSPVPGEAAAGSEGGRPTDDDSFSDRETDAASWLDPPSDYSDDSDVTDEELAALFCRMRAYARAINATASQRCRVVVAGGRMPCLAATVLLLFVPHLPRTNVIALCQPRVNQLRALVAARLGVAPHDVHGLAEWGNPPAGRAWLDLAAAAVSRHQGAVRGPAGYRRPLQQVLHERQWLAEQLPRLLAERAGSPLRPAGAEVSALPLAVCLADTLRRWWAGADDGRLESLGVASEGEFGVPEQLVLSAPVRLIAGDFRVCRAMPLSGEGAAAVRAAVAQMVGWLWRFGVRLSVSGRHCTLSACPSSTVTCSGSGERLLSDTELASGTDDKAGDEQQRLDGEEGDGDGTTERGPPPAGQPGATDTEPAADGSERISPTLTTPVSSAGSERGPSDQPGSADSGPRPGSAQGERTSISGDAQRRESAKDAAATAPSEERSPATSGERTAAAAGDRTAGSAGPEAAGTPAEAGSTPSPGAPGGGAPAGPTLTSEGERHYIPVQPDQ